MKFNEKLISLFDLKPKELLRAEKQFRARKIKYQEEATLAEMLEQRCHSLRVLVVGDKTVKEHPGTGGGKRLLTAKAVWDCTKLLAEEGNPDFDLPKLYNKIRDHLGINIDQAIESRVTSHMYLLAKRGSVTRIGRGKYCFVK